MRNFSLMFFVMFVCLLQAATPINYSSAQEIKPQKLAPGVLQIIAPEIDPRDTHTLPMRTPGVEATPFEPKTTSVAKTLAFQSKRIVMFRDVWQLEFAFLPLRQIEIDVPVQGGTTVKRIYWYLCYRVRNTGNVLVNEPITDPKFGTVEYEKRANFEKLSPERRDAQIDKLVKETLFTRFLGNFKLRGWVENVATGEYTQLTYRPVIDPAVIDAIRRKEDAATELLTNIEIMKKSLPIVSPRSEHGGIWGCAVWENVDPRIDYVSIIINGLTNAYRLQRTTDGELTTVQKTLQLNFWRPGDAVNLADDKIVYGVPFSEDYRKQIEICSRYDLPGPVLEGFDVDKETTRRRRVIEIDGQVALRTLQSNLAEKLDGGQLPQEVVDAFVNAGMALPDGIAPKTTVQGKQWTITTEIDGEPKTILLQLTPQFWEPEVKGGIRFLKTLDHLWIYQ